MDETEFKIQLEIKLKELANIFMIYYHPCQIQGSKCLVGEVPCCQSPYFDTSKPCPYIDECSKHKTLSCALWFCRTALNDMDENCKESFYALEKIAKIYNLIGRPYLGGGYVGRSRY